MNSIDLHSDDRALREEIERLRTELSHSLAELEQLQTQTRPYLLALYQQKIGQAELECLRLQCRAEWLRRYAEQVQAARNHGLPVVPKSIEANLHRELSDFWARLRDAASKVEAAQQFLSHLMTSEDAREFRRLYRNLVKRLHPDLVPVQTDRDALCWRRVQQAYEDGDLEEMKAVWEMIQNLPEAEGRNGRDELKAQCQRLEEQIGKVRARFVSLESQPPFNMRAQLEDEAWVTAKRAEIEERKRQWREKALSIETHLRALLGGNHDGITFEFSAN